MHIRIRIKGKSPLLMSDNKMADPLNPHAQRLSAVSKKRAKTIEDHLKIAELEWRGRLYHEPVKGIYIPRRVIRAMVAAGAKTDKKGKAVKADLRASDATLTFKAPDGTVPADKTDTDLAALFDYTDADGEKPFVNRSLVKVGQATVARTRPQFKVWECEAEMEFTAFDKSDIIRWIKYAGDRGIGDGRALGFGNFNLTHVDGVAVQED